MARMDGIALGAIATGSLFAYAGLKGYSIPHAIQSVVSGQNPAVKANKANQIAGEAGLGPANSTAGQYNIGAGAPGGSPSRNQGIAKLLAAKYGWSSGPEWDALVSLWESESSWDNTIWNTTQPCSGDAYAYGIPQACGHGGSKTIPGHGSVCPFPAGDAGNPPECGGTSNAASQINWGLAYIHANYGSPSNTPHGGY